MDYDLVSNDEAMRQWGPRLRDDLGIAPPTSLTLATTLFNELCAIPSLRAGADDEPVLFTERFNELACFMNYLGARQAQGTIELLENRAHLILSNYICFVYLGESCFARLKKLTPAGSTARKCFQFLTDNPVRAFRNAIATPTGRWLMAPSRFGQEKVQKTNHYLASPLEMTNVASGFICRCVLQQVRSPP